MYLMTTIVKFQKKIVYENMCTYHYVMNVFLKRAIVLKNILFYFN